MTVTPDHRRLRTWRALQSLLFGFVLVLAASFTTSVAPRRPVLDGSGQPVHRDGHSYPIYELDTAADLRANWPSYLGGLVGLGLIVRAAVIRFGSSASPQ
jgi:hypothetical protein